MKRMFRNAKAASAVEYGLLVSLIGVVSLGSVFQFGTNARDTFNGLSNTVESRVLGGGGSGGQAGDGEGASIVLAANGTAENCYDPANINTIGQAGWAGCEGMLIVDDALLRGAASTWAGGDGTFSILGPDNNSYTFGDSTFNVFTGQVTDMAYLFATSNFNGDIGYWDTSRVFDMYAMFVQSASFNQDIGAWDVSSVSSMGFMLDSAAVFDQDLSGWCVSNISAKPNRFDSNSGFAGEAAVQPQWGTCPGS